MKTSILFSLKMAVGGGGLLQDCHGFSVFIIVPIPAVLTPRWLMCDVHSLSMLALYHSTQGPFGTTRPPRLVSTFGSGR